MIKNKSNNMKREREREKHIRRKLFLFSLFFCLLSALERKRALSCRFSPCRASRSIYRDVLRYSPPLFSSRRPSCVYKHCKRVPCRSALSFPPLTSSTTSHSFFFWFSFFSSWYWSIKKKRKCPARATCHQSDEDGAVINGWVDLYACRSSSTYPPEHRNRKW